jgi:hypothetical protein
MEARASSGFDEKRLGHNLTYFVLRDKNNDGKKYYQHR